MGRTSTRRGEILATAGALFARRGYGSVSLEDIASGIRWSKAGVYYHFNRKQDVLAAIVEPVLDRGDELLVTHKGDPRGLLEGYVDLMLEHRDAVQVLLSDPAAIMATDLGPRIRAQHQATIAALAYPRRSVDARARAAAALAVAHTVAGWTLAAEPNRAIRTTVLEASRRALSGQTGWQTNP